MEGTSWFPWFVMVLGMGTVFIGLVCLIFLTKLMSAVLNKKAEPAAVSAAPVTAVAAPTAAPASNRQEIVAAISAAVAVTMGNEPGSLRIHNIRKI